MLRGKKRTGKRRGCRYEKSLCSRHRHHDRPGYDQRLWTGFPAGGGFQCRTDDADRYRSVGGIHRDRGGVCRLLQSQSQLPGGIRVRSELLRLNEDAPFRRGFRRRSLYHHQPAGKFGPLSIRAGAVFPERQAGSFRHVRRADRKLYLY